LDRGVILSLVGFFLVTFYLIKIDQKLKAERSFCALGLYAGPPFCRAVAFLLFFLYYNPVFGEGSIWLGLPGRGFLWWGIFGGGLCNVSVKQKCS
jgi:hypothetical protein